jgi:hypothetical protein
LLLLPLMLLLLALLLLLLLLVLLCSALAGQVAANSVDFEGKQR